MRVAVNGDILELPEQIDYIYHLLTHLSLEERIVIVEHNGTIIPKQDYDRLQLSDGDRVEIVQFVGGG
ncbi:sulfur carrier protein ThiS [Paenibacillus sp. 1001270B_150601_E10]|uniref:sulfur carrier protein ThiS n=1 Tax=Paenibacillus sp. 1001270B_150601_E10 TaxID=2787079 RepID=UPI0018A0683F|nr:sulfur carrier protein ThiS [Paenibacillus sp. 1001270B_150601_E10]